MPIIKKWKIIKMIIVIVFVLYTSTEAKRKIIDRKIVFER